MNVKNNDKIEDNANNKKIVFLSNRLNKHKPNFFENTFNSQNLEKRINKQEFEIRIERLISNIKNLSLLNIAIIIKELLLIKATIRNIIFLINLRLRYENVDNEGGWDKSKEEQISNQIYEDLIPCFDYLVWELIPPVSEISKSLLLEQELKVEKAVVYYKEFFPIESRINQIIFQHYNDIIQKEINVDLAKIIYFLTYCRHIIFERAFQEKDLNDFKKFSYIIKKSEITKVLCDKEKTEIIFNKDEIETIIKYFSCEFGSEKNEFFSVIQDTYFSKKLFIANKSGDQILFPIFTNILKKLKEILTEIIKTKYPKRFIKFSEKYPEYLEVEAKNIFQSLFKKKYYNGVFIDGIYETDGLIQYKDYLIIIECKKRDLEDSNVCEGFKEIKNDIQKSFVKAIKQLKQRKIYVESKTTTTISLYNSNSKNKKIVGTIDLKNITKIICIIITSDDFSSILGSKYYHDILRLEILKENIFTISIKNLILFYLILPQPTLFLHYLLSKNKFILNSENFVIFQEELDMIGLYLDGFLNVNVMRTDFIVDDYSIKLNYYLTLHRGDRNYFLKKINPLIMRYNKFYNFFEIIDKLNIKHSLDFSLFLLSIDVKNLIIINDFLILAKHKVKEKKRTLYSRCSVLMEEFDTMCVICIVKALSKNYFEHILNNMPEKLKDFERYYNKIVLIMATPDLKKIKIIDTTKKHKKSIKYTKKV